MRTKWTATTGEGKVTKKKCSPGGEHVSTRHPACAVAYPTCHGGALAQPRLSDHTNEDNGAGSLSTHLLRRYTYGEKNRRRKLNSPDLDKTGQQMEIQAEEFDKLCTGKKATLFKLLDNVCAFHSVDRLPLKTEELHCEPSDVVFFGREGNALEKFRFDWLNPGCLAIKTKTMALAVFPYTSSDDIRRAGRTGDES